MTTPHPQQSASTRTPPPPPLFEPMPPEASGVTVLETLLKNPARIIHELHLGKQSAPLVWPPLLALVCMAVYGVVVGALVGGEQLWIAPVKIALGTLFAVLICLPSLYVFTCLGGADVRLRTTCGALFAAVGLSSLLLIGFAPVAWIFSQSTDSVAFMGGLHLIFWVISMYFGLGLLGLMSTMLGVRDSGHLKLWGAIFIVVCLQMMTTLRPIIGTADTFLPTEKRFFLAHWIETLSQPRESPAR